MLCVLHETFLAGTIWQKHAVRMNDFTGIDSADAWRMYLHPHELVDYTVALRPKRFPQREKLPASDRKQ